MNLTQLFGGSLLLLAVFIELVQPLCVLESDFGFKINCAFKKAGLFRVRNLGGIKAHASLGFSLGDELGFEQSLTNQDPSRRRSVSVKNGAPPNLVSNPAGRPGMRQEKRGKQNRIMMRPMAPPVSRPNQQAMDKLTSLHRRTTTMQPIIVSGPTVEAPAINRYTSTMAKPMPMGVPAFRPLPPKDDNLQVVPITSSKKSYSPLQIPQSKGPGLVYQSEKYPQSHNQISKMVSQMTAVQYSQPHLIKFTPTPILVNTPKYYSMPTTVNPFLPMPVSPTQAISIIPAPVFKEMPVTYSQTIFQRPISNFVDPVPHQIHDVASNYAYNIKKVDDYNTITGYGDDTTLKFNKEDINSKIAEIAKAGNISMEAVEAAIALRQQQLLNKYANIPLPVAPTTTSTTTTTTTEEPFVFQPEPEPQIIVAAPPQKPMRIPTSGKVMNAPREYYPVGYEKNFDDHFQSKVDLPDTSFHCGDQKYFPGLYGDESLGCMVFHVCALTDDGLVMKSFLCPESTLFDQTILKCNWWFYVDCKNTRKLYETNIPVSKSYQLMKALTFFSSYKKEMEDGRPKSPEDVNGVKEAISILQNQDNQAKPVQSAESSNTIQIVTPQPYVDERANHKTEYVTQPAPVYRANRNFNLSNDRNNTNIPTNSEQTSNSDFKLVTVNAGLNFNKENTTVVTVNSTTSDTSRDKTHRRRMVLRNRNTTTTVATTTTSKPEVTTSSIEIIKQQIQPLESLNIRPERLTDLIEALEIDPADLKDIKGLPPIKRFYRSSAERDSIKDKEIAVVNNEKVQIIRPTPLSRFVGEYPTPTATIAKLDEAILGGQHLRYKKDTVNIVMPTRSEDTRSKNQT